MYLSYYQLIHFSGWIYFKQLKESYQYHPETTEVIHGWDKLSELSLNAVEICEKGFDSVWDVQFLSFLLNNFKEGFLSEEKRWKPKESNQDL